MKFLFLIMLVNGDVHMECAYSEQDAWEASIDYVMEDIDYLINTHEQCDWR